MVLCSGKLYYDFYYDANEKDPLKVNRLIPPQVAIVRIEQLYPFAEDQLQHIHRKYRRAAQWVWAQEEPQNMGAWTFIEPRLRALGIEAQYVGRDASASPATGSFKIHVREQKELVETAIEGPVPHLVLAIKPPPAKEARSADQAVATGS